MIPVPSVPRLLVSVRDLAEAHAALLGGADIIDVKEPARGSLGRADEAVIQQIIRFVPNQSPGTAVSVALGEVTDACRPFDMGGPNHLTFAKLGLAGLGQKSRWVEEWLDVRRAFTDHSVTPIQWVAVAYADAPAAAAPPVDEVMQAAAQTDCAGLLIDTFHKDGGRLLDHISALSLAALAAESRRRSLFFAVAGRLRIEDVAALRPVRPDVVAVRSAACDGDDRQAQVCPRRVRALRHELFDAVATATLTNITASR